MMGEPLLLEQQNFVFRKIGVESGGSLVFEQINKE